MEPIFLPSRFQDGAPGVVAWGFEVPGEAQPKRRPRFHRMAQGVRTHPDPRDVAFESHVAFFFRSTPPPEALPWPWRGEVALWACFERVPPKGLGKARTARALAGDLQPISRPDLDNLVKAVKDSLNQQAYVDDGQVVEVRAWKAYGAVPRTRIRLATLQPPS